MTESERRLRRFDSWATSFRRRVPDHDLFAAVAWTAYHVVKLPPGTISEAALVLGIPGSTRGARNQKLRRLERKGQFPQAPRSLAHGDRYWLPEALAEIVATREAK